MCREGAVDYDGISVKCSWTDQFSAGSEEIEEKEAWEGRLGPDERGLRTPS